MAGVTSPRITMTSSAMRGYSPNVPRTNVRSGQSRAARHPGMPPCTPYAFASYDAASTTPPPVLPPTAIGLPRRAGSSNCSTEA